jgi:hypothetical protein
MFHRRDEILIYNAYTTEGNNKTVMGKLRWRQLRLCLKRALRYLDQDCCESGENSCVNCLRMKDCLKVIITELKFAQLINKFLHEEIRLKAGQSMSTGNLSKCVGYNSHEKKYEWKWMEWNTVQ